MNMNNGSNIPNVEPGIPPQSAVSVYGQSDAMDDFPVLKAFQQYVDAEQAKAQKRMTTLCIFFAIILTIVVGVFVAIIMSMSNAKNDSNDRLIQMLMERERQHSLAAQAPQANPQNDAAFKALTDTVTSLQKQLADQQLKMIEEKQKAAEEAVKRAAEAAAAQVKVQQQAESPSPDQIALDKKNQAAADKLAKEKELLKKQKEELAKEKERLHQQEVEMQRRRLYPEYYQKQEAEKARAAEKPAAPAADTNRTYFDEDDDDDLDEEDLDTVLGTQDVKVAPLPKKPAPAPAAKPAVSKPKKQADGSIRYFDDDDDAEVPAPAPKKPASPSPAPVANKKASATNAHDALLTGKGASSGWTIPLE